MFNKSGIIGICAAAIVLISGQAVSAQTVVLGGNPQGSLLYSMSNAIGATVTKHSKLKVDVLPQGATVFYPMMASKEVDFGMVNPMDALSAVKGKPPYDKVTHGKGFPLETLMLGSPIRLSLVTTKGSGIKSVKDLKGKRVVANYGAFASAGLTALSVLANAGLSEKDVDVVTVSSYPEGVRAVMEGRADAATASIGSGIVRELDAAKGAVILPVDPSDAAMARARDVGAAFVKILVKKGPPGILQDTWALSYQIPIVVRSDLDDAKAYEFVKTLWKHYGELKGIFRPLATWTPDRFASTQALIPYHPGAIKFYKEVGAWTDEMAKHQAKLKAAM
jgi:TRAP transporter TAXI family solute receptor